VRQSILFIGTDFEQYLRLKSTFNEFDCTYSVSLPEGVNHLIPKLMWALTRTNALCMP